MAKLRFTFGTMGSGKSTQALQIHHNLSERSLKTVLTTQLDREEGRVSSRLGVSADAEVVDAATDLYELILRRIESWGRVDAVICDETQFYDPVQCEQLARVVDDLDVDVYAFGLITSFQGELFPATARMLELADVRTEIQVEARCRCGERATYNARFVNGEQVVAGQLKVVGDTGGADTEAEVSYDLLCRRHFMEGARKARGAQLELITSDDVRPADRPDHTGNVVVDAESVPASLRPADTVHPAQDPAGMSGRSKKSEAGS
jgi:thymidine kinase